MRTVTDDHLPAFTARCAPPQDFLPWKLPPTAHQLPSCEEPLKSVTVAPGDTSLDPDEIPDRPPARPLAPPAAVQETLGSAFRHSGWKEVRRRVYDAMKALQLSPSRLTRFAKCGSSAWIEADWSNQPTRTNGERTRPMKHRLRCNTCRDRFCIPCQGTRARIVARTLISLLGDQPARFITLTRKHTDAPLRDQIDALYEGYKRLRKTLLWQRGCYAAAAMLEIKRSRDDGCWHPHLHVLAKGKYIPHADLKAEWHRITKDSFIVDIRMITQPEKAAAYVSKYVTKPMVATYSTDADALVEAIEAMHHRRTVLLTGEWRRLPMEKPTDEGLWEYVGTLESILNRAMAGDEGAVRILDSLRSDHRWDKTPIARSP